MSTEKNLERVIAMDWKDYVSSPGILKVEQKYPNSTDKTKRAEVNFLMRRPAGNYQSVLIRLPEIKYVYREIVSPKGPGYFKKLISKLDVENDEEQNKLLKFLETFNEDLAKAFVDNKDCLELIETSSIVDDALEGKLKPLIDAIKGPLVYEYNEKNKKRSGIKGYSLMISPKSYKNDGVKIEDCKFCKPIMVLGKAERDAAPLSEEEYDNLIGWAPNEAVSFANGEIRPKREGKSSPVFKAYVFLSSASIFVNASINTRLSAKNVLVTHTEKIHSSSGVDKNMSELIAGLTLSEEDIRKNDENLAKKGEATSSAEQPESVEDVNFNDISSLNTDDIENFA